MIQIFLAVFSFIILILIFLRRYLLVEKGFSLSSHLSHKKSFFGHYAEQASFEVTSEEIIPPINSIDFKNLAKADLLFKKAEIQFAKADFKEAEKLLIQALSLNPGLIDAYHKIGLIYLHQRQFTKAETIFRKLAISVLTEPSYCSNLGLALYHQKKLEEAKSFYKKALELDNSRAGRFFSLSQILIDLGEFEDALSNLKKAIEMEPHNLNYLLSLAHFYLEQSKIEDAKILLEEIQKEFPRDEAVKELFEKLQNKEK